MSSLMGGTGGPDGGLVFAANDIRLAAEFVQDHDMVEIPPDAPWNLFGYATGFWPGTGGMDASGQEWLAPVWFDQPEVSRGHNSRFGFTGVTRDVYGSAVGGVTVKCFRTSDDLRTDQVLSDASGNFTVSTPYYPDAHYLVAYKPGSPDTEGTTAQTLVAS